MLTSACSCRVVKALDALEREGLVERIQGRGTFVAKRA